MTGSNSFSYPSCLEMLRNSRDLAGRWATGACYRVQKQSDQGSQCPKWGDRSHMALPSSLSFPGPLWSLPLAVG